MAPIEALVGLQEAIVIAYWAVLKSWKPEEVRLRKPTKHLMELSEMCLFGRCWRLSSSLLGPSGKFIWAILKHILGRIGATVGKLGAPWAIFAALEARTGCLGNYIGHFDAKEGAREASGQPRGLRGGEGDARLCR